MIYEVKSSQFGSRSGELPGKTNKEKKRRYKKAVSAVTQNTSLEMLQTVKQS